MWEFLRLMFLAHTFLLTPKPVDITDSWLPVQIDGSMESLNSRARLEIDISPMIDAKRNVIERLDDAKQRFPHGCVEARLKTKDGREVAITNAAEAVSTPETYLILRKPDEMELDVQFTGLSIRASCPIAAAKIYWHNMGK